MKRILLGLLALTITFSSAAAQRPFYEYTFITAQRPQADDIAAARNALHPALAHHIWVEHRQMDRWNGSGSIWFSIDHGVANPDWVDGAEMYDAGLPLRAALGAEPKQPVYLVELKFGIPAQPNTAAAAEALQVADQLAKAVKARAFIDEETQQLYHIAQLQKWLAASKDARADIAHAINFRWDEFSELGERRTRGLRKVGLPDLIVADWIADSSVSALFQPLAHVMLAGKLTPRPGARYEWKTRDPAFRGRVPAFGMRPDGLGILQFSARPEQGASALPDTVGIEFAGPPALHAIERQAMFLHAIYPSHYDHLPQKQALEIVLAIARVKTQVDEMRAQFQDLKKRGIRVFAAYRMDLAVSRAALGKLGRPESIEWHEIVEWKETGATSVRGWVGDPRQDGAVFLLKPPIKIDDKIYLYRDSDLPDAMIEDFLVISGDGSARGGEVAALVSKLRD